MRPDEFAESSNPYLSAILEATPDLVSISDPQGKILYMNPAGRRMLGLGAEHDFSTGTAWDFFPEWARKKINDEGIPAAVRQGSWSGEAAVRRVDGAEIPVSQVIVSHRDGTGRLKNLSTIIRDISDLKKLNEAMLNAKKMEAASTLAAGTAHEFNNLHTTVIMAAGIIKDQTKNDADVQSCVGEILAACDRATGLTRRLLAFARQDRLSRAPAVGLNGLIAQEEKTVRAVLGDGIQLDLQLSPAEEPVAIDPKDLSQILFNLAENARDAMSAGGRATIRTETIDVVERNGDTVPAGRYTLLTFSDTGAGMTEEVKSHLFEPFFTTKGRAVGTGLGLAALYGIVKRLGGIVKVESSPGLGATFRIYMPCHRSRAIPGSSAA